MLSTSRDTHTALGVSWQHLSLIVGGTIRLSLAFVIEHGIVR
jgi:hypothetical protein